MILILKFEDLPPMEFFSNPEYPFILISKEGYTYSNKLKKLKKFSVARGGYLRSTLFNVVKKRKKAIYLHRLIAETFIPVDNMNTLTVNHKDGNKLNNSLTNLEWITRSENIKHCYDILKTHTGLKTRKLNEFELLTLATLKGNFSQSKLSFYIKSPQSTVSRIFSGKRYPEFNFLFKGN